MERPETTLAEKALTRLRGLAKGNGLSPDLIQLIKANEATYTLEGEIQLTPDFHVERTFGFGRADGKGKKLFPSFLALKEEINNLKQAFEKDGTWASAALAEIEKAPGHGWGLEEAHIVWEKNETRLAASENCPTCKGSGRLSCPYCMGIGTTPCLYCEGRGQEICTTCAGRGEDPANPAKSCQTCHGGRFMTCRFCQGTGKTPCAQCQSQGYTACADCQGTGAVREEATLTRRAKLHFSLGRTTDLPSGLLRQMDRLGLSAIGKSHGEIVMTPPAPDAEKMEDRTKIRLTAKIPYADLKIRIGKTESIVSVFGQNARLSGVPAFLDKTLADTFKKLALAARGQASLDKLLSIRLAKEALDLVLAGKTNPNHLRMLYPVGLSGSAAQAVMKNMSLALKQQTLKIRGVVAGALVLASGGIFAALLLTSALTDVTRDMSLKLTRSIEVLTPLAFMGGAWAALSHVTRWALRSKYPQAKIATTPNIGKTGLIALTAIAALYVLLSLFAGSDWHAFLLGKSN